MVLETTGLVDFQVGGKTYQTWYKVIGDLRSSARRPLVALHGGPGMSHHYMLPHTTLSTRAGIPVVFYDQIGNGKSSHVRDAPDEFWTPKLFMDELDNLLQHLGIQNDFDLLGQSWGGMLGGHYAAERAPKGLKRLIIANSPASVELYEAGTSELLNEFPEELVKMLRKHETEETTDAQEYQDGMQGFYKKHVCNMDPWPAELVESFASLDANPTVYRTMFGPSEFHATGSLKKWSIVDILHQIPYPTLLISSPRDSVQKAAVLPWFRNIQKIKWVELQNSSHLAQFEEPDRYFEVLMEFLEAT
ncbi:hypothetical protein SERLA73DRAFT_109000 [Serpula lacrymans var. lacrymans S7.3]|uniref:AB hydrolase-1 domain-containing protein n=2 Tax=Serpula lacrymans var. lacrymans TaxID=341189 RepID=F8Q0A4_SERL3|nr:uncharacterized protein SERLADRAFT_361820 [Serpula lacrymans var. lacrymans S7.9]EGN97771.1 hypothetical protein SERLA73DRAFT_109000 [Serpula lacrymans var. lacrymans S7.3]EGO23365.1 hypothetical protein SERLADRAFT_361820 [Serpula lacrymans var. lacrymans S7.9]